jgi:hypothetical protein
MNNIRNNIAIEFAYLLKYNEFLLNKKYNDNIVNKKKQASFCSICCDDCICMNSNYKLFNVKNNVKNMMCSKYCNEK